MDLIGHNAVAGLALRWKVMRTETAVAPHVDHLGVLVAYDHDKFDKEDLVTNVKHGLMCASWEGHQGHPEYMKGTRCHGI